MSKMLLYSKLYDLLTKSGNGKFELKCTIKELFGRNDALKYIYFQTESEVPCLLNISSKHEIKMDTTRPMASGANKFLSLSRWTDSKIGFDAVIAADPEMTMVKEIKANSSPHSLIDLLKKIYPSLTAIPYRAALLSQEYLLVLDDAGEVDVYYTKGPKHTKLLIVVDLEILLFKNIIPEVERVHRSILELLQNSNETYWELLLELLKKCQQFKIITRGKLNTKGSNSQFINSSQGPRAESIIIDQSMKINMSHNAIKLALECFDE
ncbi:MAG: hypothetical protein ACRCZ0_02670 [Cetobacterium sp.]